VNYEERINSAKLICENHIAYYSIQLWELREIYDYKIKERVQIPSPKGTGVLIYYRNIHFLFTAKHVVDDVNEDNLLYIRTDEEEFMSITGDVFLRDLKETYIIDVAFIRLDSHIVKLINSIINLRFLNPENIPAFYRPTRSDKLIAAGYPYLLTKTYDKADEINVRATYQFLNRVNLKIYKYYKYDPIIKIGLSLHGRGTTLDDKKRVDRINPRGMSGGGVWKIGFENFLGETLTRFHLVGILTNYTNDKYHAMWATNIDQIMIYLNKVYGFQPKLQSTKT
jgi:hypothetical protein